MTTQFAEAVSKYKDGKIVQSGRTELLKKFRDQFGLKSDDTFFRAIKGDAIPTPDQHNWLIVNITYYWEYYSSVENEASVDKETA